MAVIDIRLNTLAQLFDAMDPAPFHDKALDPKAEAYLLSCAQEHPPGEPLTLRFFVPTELRAYEAEIVTAVHTHFHLALHAAKRHARRRSRIGHATLIIGLLVLIACLVLRSLMPSEGVLVQAMGEGLLILGWVALWRPMEVLLFERWESRQERQYLQALARAGIGFELHDGAMARTTGTPR